MIQEQFDNSLLSLFASKHKCSLTNIVSGIQITVFDVWMIQY